MQTGKRRCTMIAIGPFQPDKTVGTPLVYIYIFHLSINYRESLIPKLLTTQ